MKFVTIALLLISSFLSLKHGWDAFQPAQCNCYSVDYGVFVTGRKCQNGLHRNPISYVAIAIDLVKIPF